MTTLAFIGDLMLGRLVSEETARRPPGDFWGTTLPVLRAADAVFANLECAITTQVEPWRRTYKAFHFRAGPDAIELLRVADIRFVSLANNHVLDFEVAGLLDTLDHLDRAAIAHAGAGRTSAEARRPAVVEAAGCRVGVISLTDNEPAFAAGTTQPGVNFSAIRPSREIIEPIAESARNLRAGGADLVVLSLHWGPNMVEMPPRTFREFAHRTIADGIDLIHGHSAHVFQGVEPRGRGMILYDTGDFLDDYAVDAVLRNDWSFIFLVDVENGRIERLRMLPVRLRFARVDLATGDEADRIRQTMVRRSRDFGTTFTEGASGPDILCVEQPDTIGAD